MRPLALLLLGLSGCFETSVSSVMTRSCINRAAVIGDSLADNFSMLDCANGTLTTQILADGSHVLATCTCPKMPSDPAVVTP